MVMRLATRSCQLAVCVFAVAALCLATGCFAATTDVAHVTQDNNVMAVKEVNEVAGGTMGRGLSAVHPEVLDVSATENAGKEIDIGDDTTRRVLTGSSGGGGNFFYKYSGGQCYSSCCKYWFGRYWFGGRYEYNGGHGNGYRGGGGNRRYYYRNRKYYCYWNCCKRYFNRYYSDHKNN